MMIDMKTLLVMMMMMIMRPTITSSRNFVS